jgi:SAM-dependent methyltransferase
MTSTSSIQPSDSSQTSERYPTWNGIIPLPPHSLLWSVGGASLELFLVVADAWNQAMSPYIQPNTTVLDIGCGCGRSARTLLLYPDVARYIGFDVIPENIEWCRKFIEPLSAGRARFFHFDLYSAEYRPHGTLRASELVFPCEESSADLIVAASLFTHLLEPDAVHYLHEIGRVISGRGYALLSIHTNVPPGEKFTGTEARIDVAPEYFLKLASDAGLKLERELDLCGQTLLIFSRSRRAVSMRGETKEHGEPVRKSSSASTTPGADLYLDLLKKSVLGEIYVENELRLLYLRDCLKGRDMFNPSIYLDIRRGKSDMFREYVCGHETGIHYGQSLDNLGFQNTMIGRRRLENLHGCLESILRDGVKGDCIECGVWRGGAALYMRGFWAAHQASDRTVWLADSFEGLPKPSLAADQDLDLSAAKFPMLAVDQETVRELFHRYGLLDSQVKFLKGWFKDTLSSAPIERLSLLRLDGDLYESTWDSLSALYPKVEPGGFVIVDDYGCLPQCRQAVDEFRRQNGIAESIREIDWTGVYWRKQR